MWYFWSLSYPFFPGPLYSQWLPGLCLTTRNTLLMQQIAEAQAEAILKLQMQQGEIWAPRKMWNWATVTFKWESEKKSKKRWGARRERNEKGSVSVTINCFQWQSSVGRLPALHQTRVSLYMCMCVHPFVHLSIQGLKLTSKHSHCFFTYVTYSLVITNKPNWGCKRKVMCSN